MRSQVVAEHPEVRVRRPPGRERGGVIRRRQVARPARGGSRPSRAASRSGRRARGPTSAAARSSSSALSRISTVITCTCLPPCGAASRSVRDGAPGARRTPRRACAARRGARRGVVDRDADLREPGAQERPRLRLVDVPAVGVEHRDVAPAERRGRSRRGRGGRRARRPRSRRGTSRARSAPARSAAKSASVSSSPRRARRSARSRRSCTACCSGW